ncbi:MAG: hypothetical protein SYC29_06365 [Planctomycetota bacterium]|nr:hypothetical protein [Planctomycetota bacterium]
MCALCFWIGVLTIGPSARASDDESDIVAEPPAEAYEEPPSFLAPMPAIEFDAAVYQPAAEEQREIAFLIEQLTEIDKPDFGIASWMSGSQFAPVKSSGEFHAGIIMIDHGLETSEPLERLVELGPEAIPALLGALNDATPGRLVKDWEGVMGAMWYGREIPTNPAHPREQAVREAHANFFPEGRHSMSGFGDRIRKHEVTRGDICFVVLGQIVNRHYEATRYQPTSCMVINSPTHDPECATILREIWGSDDPARMLFESLMIDLHTRGGWRSTDYQRGAVMRLLYYFPEQSAELIRRRIDAFDVHRIPTTDDRRGAWQERLDANGVDAASFLEAAAAVGHPTITEALLGVVRRTDDPNIFKACLSESVVEAAPDLVFRRMREILTVAPPPERGPFGPEYRVLRAAVLLFPERSRLLFDIYLEHGTLECRRAVIHALNKLEAPVPWAVELLQPFLEDRADTGWEYGPNYDRKPIRVCDEAARTLIHHVEGATFELEGEPANLDRQIENIRRRIAGEPIVEDAAATRPPIDFDSLPTIGPTAVLELDEQIGRIYGFSDEHTIYCGKGYRADGWGYDTAAIDAATGTLTDRIRLDQWQGGVSILRPITGTRALCYHGSDPGQIVVRDIRTGLELWRIEIPFHDGVQPGDPRQVRNLGDIFVSGDERWVVALTGDGSLHTIDLETGEHQKVWRREGEPKHRTHLRGTLTPVQGTNRFLIEFFAEDDPLRVWDQDTRMMTEITKVPTWAWRSAWGRYACNQLNNRLLFWDLKARKPIDLSLPEGAEVSDLLCDGDQSALVVATAEGPMYVIDLATVAPIARLSPPKTTGRVSLRLSSDDRLLFWKADLTQYERGSCEPSDEGTVLAVFDVGDLLR